MIVLLLVVVVVNEGIKRCPVSTNDEYSEVYESKILIKPSNFEVHLEKRHLVISSAGRGDTAKLGVTERQVLDTLEL